MRARKYGLWKPALYLKSKLDYSAFIIKIDGSHAYRQDAYM